jgi:hypothetical protein
MSVGLSPASQHLLRSGVSARFWIAIILAIVAAALVERSLIDTTPDVSWLITLGEKLLDGERPYVDFIEVNPPASIWIYLPAILFARFVGVTPEFAVGLFVFAGVAVSLCISARILRDGGILRNPGPLVALFTAALILLPMVVFAQREHIALISLLPMLAVSTVRAEGKPVALHWSIVAGLGAGVTAAIKPHFIFPILFAVGTSAICVRSWRPILALENWISAGLLAIYTAAVFVLYPTFIHDVMPIVVAVYVPQKASLVDLMTLGAMPLWCGALLTIFALKRGAAFEPPFVLLLAASAGFLVAFVVQQKGLPYHSYPMLALILVAAVVAVCDRLLAGADIIRFAGMATVAAILVMTLRWFAPMVDLGSLKGPILASVSRPKVLNISSSLVDVGFPLTRQLGGTWVGRSCGQWIAASAMAIKLQGTDEATIAAMDRYIERDRAGLIQDIATKKPDIILVDRVHFDWLKWAKSDPVLARELARYRELVSAKGILVLRRNES